jgi:hypothetical protein
MPSFRKLSPAEIPAKVSTLSARAQVAQPYDALLADFAIGDYGRAELIAGERRNAVRSRLHAAARRRGLALRFRPGPGPLIFRVEAAPAVVIPTPVGTPLVGARRDPAPPRPFQSSRQRQTAAERYRAVLPRWMREGSQSERRDGIKRRQGR